MKMIRYAFLLIATIPFLLNAQSIHQENILYGAAYYHEYMPYERLDEDVRLMKEAGISHPDHQYAWPLIAKSGVNDDGNWVHFYYNYSSEGMEFSYPHSNGLELVSGKSVEEGESLTVEAWDVIIIEED
jgi:beta-galactosidase